MVLRFRAHASHGGPTALSADDEGRALSFADVLAALEEGRAARLALTETLAAIPHEGFFFEVAPITRAVASREFQAVVLDARPLAHVAADPAPFAEHFTRARDAGVTSFASLGKDAYLVAPLPKGEPSAYGHLAAFVRAAPPAQIDAFWATAAHAARARVSSAPLWISTAGLGVPWLHLRLDSRPKYYRHAPYHTPPTE